ncbi:MAG: sugar-binding protein, partial [Armatimonadia bacterium]
AEYQAKARQRGQQFIKVIGRHLPDNVLLTFFTYSIFPGEMAIQDTAKRNQALAQHGYGLYHSFLNGMLDEIGSRMSITDGNEPSYYYENSEKFLDAFHMMRQRALNLIPQEDVVKHQTQAQVSQALYMDYVFARVPWKGIPALWMKDDERAKWFEHNVYWALKTTDEFVWLYSEKMDWWKNKDIPAGMEEAIVSARAKIAAGQSLGYDLRDRMKEIEARKQAEIRDKLIRRTADIPVLKAMPPKIDGVLDDEAWKSAATLPNFVGYFGATEGDLKAKTRALVTYDAINLYVAISAQEPTPDKMAIVGANHDDAVWNGDTFDIFLSAAADALPYYHFILNPKNVQWDAVFDTDNNMDFNPNWRSATRIGDKEWVAEMAIPWKDLKIGPQPGLKLRANLCRQRIPGKEQSCWSQTVRGFMESENFGTWILR